MPTNESTKRPPIVTVLGHVDHGKSSLLDYIRGANTIEGEAGGITQHVAAYVATHKNDDGEHKITFIDTPGHAAFSNMRSRGASVADIAILVVSAEDGVKTQTKEALKAIQESKTPFIVAINKIDSPKANVDMAKQSLAEAEVYVEGYGGDVPVAEISAKVGDGVSELLDLIVLLAEMEEIVADPDKPSEGVVLESHLDTRRGVAATILVLSGTLRKGEFIATAGVTAPTRTMLDEHGKQVEVAPASSPVTIIGFSSLPTAGEQWAAHKDKKRAELAAKEFASVQARELELSDKEVVLPLIIKTDTLGTLEAIKDELKTHESEKVGFNLINSGVGDVGENDVQSLSAGGYILGFNVSADSHARDVAGKIGVQIETFDIIYKLFEWLDELVVKSEPVDNSPVVTGEVKVLKIFSQTKNKQLVGGRVTSGEIKPGDKINILRRDNEIGEGKIGTLQVGSAESKKVLEGDEFGSMIESKSTIAEGDTLQALNKRV